MNAIDGAERLHALARDARRRQRDLGGARRRDRRVQGRRLRPGHRRDLGHRPGRRGDRAARRRVALRDDAGVRRREPAREDRHARLRRLRRDQQVRPQAAPRTRCATCASRCSATARRSAQTPDDDAGVRHHRRALQRRRRDRAVPGASLPRLAEHGLWPREPGTLPAVATQRLAPAPAPIVPPDARALPRRDRRGGARLPAARRRAGARSRASGSSCAAREGACSTQAGKRRAPTLERADRRARTPSSTPRSQKLLDDVAGDASRPTRATSTSCRCATARSAPQLTHDVAVGHARSARSRCRATRTTARSCAGCCARTCRALPVHRRRVPVQARERGPDAHVRGRGRRRSAPTAASTCCRRTCRRSGCRPRSTR